MEDHRAGTKQMAAQPGAFSPRQMRVRAVVLDVGRERASSNQAAFEECM